MINLQIRKPIAYTAIALVIGAVAGTNFTGRIGHNVDLELISLPVKIDPVIRVCQDFIDNLVDYTKLSEDAILPSGWTISEVRKDENGRSMISTDFDVGTVKFTGTCFIEESEVFDHHLTRRDK
jgi:hypothetical protein